MNIIICKNIYITGSKTFIKLKCMTVIAQRPRGKVEEYFYNVSYAQEKNAYSAVIGSRSLKITIKSIWLMVVLGIVCPY